ncbi:MAG: T9SS type A sorting domain-containing protein [Candidatus Marinimicrobia bacterium]|nr:T9SS type A sorting domain-containing protein [Candidatus Neomarinimicrobiota bacterium]
MMMFKATVLLLMSIQLIIGATIWTEDFSAGSKYSVTLGGEGHDGSSDYFIRTDDDTGHNIGPSYTGTAGFFFAGQDIDDGGWTGSANPSQLTWSGINIDGVTSLGFEGKFASIATDKIDNADYLLVEYRIDNGSWVNLIAFENDGTQYNTYFLEDTDFNGDGEGSQLGSAMQNFTKSITSTGSSLDLRFTAAIGSEGEDCAIEDFLITGTDSSLPVELSAWQATSTKGQVVLTWTTESEIENQGFILSRSQNSESGSQELALFSTHDALLGHGSTTARNTYSYTDKDVIVGQTYTYQLSDVDYRGDVTKHSEISVTVRAAEQELKPTELTLHAAYPNPFNPELTVSFTVMGETLHATSLQVFDVNGRFVETLYDGSTDAGMYTVKWNGDKHPSGIYFIRLSSGNDVQIQGVTLLR